MRPTSDGLFSIFFLYLFIYLCIYLSTYICICSLFIYLFTCTYLWKFVLHLPALRVYVGQIIRMVVFSPIVKFYLHLSAVNRLFTYKNDSKHLSTACQTRTGPDYLKYLKYILSRFGPNQKLIIKRFFIHGDPFIDRCYAYKSFLPEKLIRGPWLRGLKAMDTISNYSK